MDKAEYKIRLDQMSRLAAHGNFGEAAKIADSIEWKKVKSVRILCMVAEIYEKDNRLQDSWRVLHYALKSSKSGKMVVYRVAELALKLGNLEEARHYCEQFERMAPHDTSRYILKYQLLKAGNASLDEQISILKEYKDREYTERWAYELAALYKEKGDNKKCVEECDDLILWFSEGSYVDKAMELKMTIKALSPTQKKLYENRFKPSEKEGEGTPGRNDNDGYRLRDSGTGYSFIIDTNTRPARMSTAVAIEKMNAAAGEALNNVRSDFRAPNVVTGARTVFGTNNEEDIQQRLADSIREVFAGIRVPEEPVEAVEESMEKAIVYESSEFNVDTVKALEPENFAATSLPVPAETPVPYDEAEGVDLKALFEETSNVLAAEILRLKRNENLAAKAAEESKNDYVSSVKEAGTLPAGKEVGEGAAAQHTGEAAPVERVGAAIDETRKPEKKQAETGMNVAADVAADGAAEKEKREVLAAEEPAVKEAAAAEEPAVEEIAAAEEPAVEETAEEPAVEETAEKPAVEETAEEPAVEETAEEPAVEETAEEPAVEETAEEPAAEETAEEPAVEETAEEPAVEETAEESAAEEAAAAEEPAIEETMEEPAVEETAEEPAVEETAEESAVEETAAAEESAAEEDMPEAAEAETAEAVASETVAGEIAADSTVDEEMPAAAEIEPTEGADEEAATKEAETADASESGAIVVEAETESVAAEEVETETARENAEEEIPAVSETETVETMEREASTPDAEAETTKESVAAEEEAEAGQESVVVVEPAVAEAEAAEDEESELAAPEAEAEAAKESVVAEEEAEAEQESVAVEEVPAVAEAEAAEAVESESAAAEAEAAEAVESESAAPEAEAEVAKESVVAEEEAEAEQERVSVEEVPAVAEAEAAEDVESELAAPEAEAEVAKESVVAEEEAEAEQESVVVEEVPAVAEAEAAEAVESEPAAEAEAAEAVESESAAPEAEAEVAKENVVAEEEAEAEQESVSVEEVPASAEAEATEDVESEPAAPEAEAAEDVESESAAFEAEAEVAKESAPPEEEAEAEAAKAPAAATDATPSFEQGSGFIFEELAEDEELERKRSLYRSLFEKETDESLGLTRPFDFQEELKKLLSDGVSLTDAAREVTKKAGETPVLEDVSLTDSSFLLDPEKAAEKVVSQADRYDYKGNRPTHPETDSLDALIEAALDRRDNEKWAAAVHEAAMLEKADYAMEIPEELFADEEDLRQEKMAVSGALTELSTVRVSEEETSQSLIDHIMERPEIISRLPLAPRRLDEAEIKILSYFSEVPSVREQVTVTLADVHNCSGDRTSRTGNVLIMGRQGAGKTRLAECLILLICKDLDIRAAKVGKVVAESFNKKDPATIVSLLAGGFLVIEGAGSLSEEAIDGLNRAMEFRTDDLVVILEDEKADLRKMLAAHPAFAAKFTSTITLPVFTNDELVTFARTYAREMGYRMDEMGTLALYTNIGQNQKYDEPVTVGKVKEMMDRAMENANRHRLARHFSRTGKDANGRIYLKEKDFEE